jgi:hypothetical protein
MIKMSEEKITQYIDAIAQKLGVATEYVWEVLTKQMVIEGWVYSITLIGGSLLMIFGLYKLAMYIKNNYDDLYDKDFEFPIMLLAAIYTVFVFVLLVVTFVETPGNIMKIVNPEYYAIKEILEAIGK